jgi:hypothetical protein
MDMQYAQDERTMRKAFHKNGRWLREPPQKLTGIRQDFVYYEVMRNKKPTLL